jgi:hypothetical protein
VFSPICKDANSGGHSEGELPQSCLLGKVMVSLTH